MAKPLIKSDQEISNIDGTPMFDGNPSIEKSLKKDRNIGKWGIGFLSAGFFIQIIYVLIISIKV